MRKIALLTPIAIALGVNVHAGPITYTLTATASGTVTNGMTVTPFTSAVMTFSLTSDTSLVTVNGSHYATPFVSNASVSVAGVGTGTLTNMVQVIDDQLDEDVGFLDASNNEFAEYAAFAATYALNAPVSPQSGFDYIWDDQATSFGLIHISGYVTDSFSATTPTPEPAGWGLAALGLAALIALKYR